METKLRCGPTIDAQTIAEGLYAMMDETYRSALAFGMLPGPIMETLGEELERKGREIWHAAKGITPEQLESALKAGDATARVCAEPIQKDRDAWVKGFRQEAERAVCSALYRVAPMVV